jgi:hypothetical protein
MKPGLFSFIGDEFENIFYYTDLFLPGIEKIMGVYHSSRDRQINIISRERMEGVSKNYAEVLNDRDNLIMIQKYRSSGVPFNWIKKDDLPFEISVQQKLVVPTLFTELENVILILRFKNDLDQLNDLLLIYFNQNLGNFGLNRSDKILTSDNKNIIGHLLYYQFKSFLQLNRTNRSLLLQLKHSVFSIINENTSLKDQLNQVLLSYGDNLVNLALQYMQDKSREYGKNYILTEETLLKIREFKGNLKHLPAILDKAVIFTENLLAVNPDEDIKIFPYSLEFNSYQIDEKTEQFTRKIDSRESRAMLLLDKLERAARTLCSRNLPLISSQVGKVMEPSVSAPAITDALSKNADFIRILLEKYPEKWELIRKEFKPLQNSLRKSSAVIINEDTA